MAEAGLEALGLAAAERAQELVREGLAGGAAHDEPGVVGQHEPRYRAEQVGLSDSRRAADEQRVVGLCGHLRDGERRGVREAVAVADDELLEGQLGVAQRAGAASPGRSSTADRRSRSPTRRREALDSPARTSSTTTFGPSTARALSRRTPPKRSRIHAVGVRGGLDQQTLLRERARRAAARARSGRWAPRRRVQAPLARASICARARRSRQRVSLLPQGVVDLTTIEGGPSGSPVRRL